MILKCEKKIKGVVVIMRISQKQDLILAVFMLK